jgi:hypothetical protein
MMDSRDYQLLNQAYSKAGLPAIMPEDQPLINEISEQCFAASFGRLSPLDDNEDFKDLARSTLKLYRDHGDNDFLEDAPYYALLAADPRIAIGMRRATDWEEVAAKHLWRQKACDVEISWSCESNAATVVFPIKQGEFVCIYKSCVPCREWFDLDHAERQASRTREFWDDDWDRR